MLKPKSNPSRSGIDPLINEESQNNSDNSMNHLSMPPNMNSNMMKHRPSVRSISEIPNVIGAQTIEKQNDLCTYILTGITWIIVVFSFPLSCVFIFRIVQEFERGKNKFILIGIFFSLIKAF